MKYLMMFCASVFLFSQSVFADNSCHGDVCIAHLNTSTETSQNKALNSSDITLSQTNPSATIQLASNPTTGYTWNVTSYDNSLITLSHQYIRSKPEMIGSGGYEVWTITATQKALNAPSQTTTINFSYLRSWEKGKVPVNVKTVVVKIN